MRINDFRAILNNDETARHLNACMKCRDSEEIKTHVFNFFLFLMGDINTAAEARTEREDKLKQIQKKITTHILNTHYDKIAKRTGFDNYDIGEINREMKLYGKLTPTHNDFHSDYFTDNSIKEGDKVDINAGDEKGSWGIVKTIINGEYHIGIAGDTNTRVYNKSEISKAN